MTGAKEGELRKGRLLHFNECQVDLEVRGEGEGGSEGEEQGNGAAIHESSREQPNTRGMTDLPDGRLLKVSVQARHLFARPLYERRWWVFSDDCV